MWVPRSGGLSSHSARACHNAGGGLSPGCTIVLASRAARWRLHNAFIDKKEQTSHKGLMDGKVHDLMLPRFAAQSHHAMAWAGML